MKKALSILLAVCLFATMLVPAFAAVPDYGKLADVAKVEFDKTEYALGDVVTDDGFLDIPAMLTCWDSNGNRTNYNANGETDTDIRAYWSSNNEVLALNQDTGKLVKIKNNTNADIRITIRVTLASGKQASTVIVVPANSTDSTDAYGYRLANAKVEKGMTFGAASVSGNATVKYTAAATTKSIDLTIGGTLVTLGAGATAAANATAIKNGVTTITIKGIVYSTPVITDNTITWTASNYTGSLPTEYIPTNDELKVVTSTLSGTVGAFVATTPNTATEFAYTVVDATATATGDTIVIDGVSYACADSSTIGAELALAVTAYNALPGKKYTAAATTNTLTLTTNDDVAAAAADVPGAVSVNAAAAALPSITPAATEGDKGVYTYTASAANGLTSLIFAGKPVTLNGGENAELVAGKIRTALTANVTIDGFAYAVSGATDKVILTAAKGGINTIMTDAVADAAELVNISPVASALTFSKGSADAAGEYLTYNIGDEITPILSNYSFTGAQKDAFKFAVRAYNGANNSHYTDIPVEGVNFEPDGVTQKYLDIYGLKFLVSTDKDGKPCLKVAEGTGFDKYVGTYVYVRVLNDKFVNAQTEKEFNIKLTDKSTASKKILPAEAQLGVNQTLDLRTLSKSVADVKSYWTVEKYGDYQTAKEAGLIAKVVMETVDGDNNAYGWTVKGLAAGVVTIKLRDAYSGAVLDSMKLNIGAGTPAVPTPSTATATVKVNEQVKLSVKNLNADEYVKWSVDNANTSLANFDGASATVYGKKEGTAVVTAKVYESKKAATDGKDPIYTFKTTVTVKAAESKPVTTPTVTGPTSNPQTGDSIFANLFF